MGVTQGRAPEPMPKDRAVLRVHFTSGALESASHILGSTSSSIFAVGLVGPYIALLSAPKSMNPQGVVAVAAIAFAFSVLAGVGAVVLRGLGRCVGHERGGGGHR